MRLHPVATAALVLFVTVCTPHAQAPTAAPAPAFTADDILKVTTLSVLDVTDDGRRVAASARRAFDNAETDHRRYGDPTYVAPTVARLMVIDAETGAIDTPLGERADLRQAAWSRDGKRLALLGLTGSTPGTVPAVRLQIWDAERKILRDLAVKGDTSVAVNSGLEWSADDKGLVVSLRSRQRDVDGTNRFKALTEGPIIVHNAKDPFLEWDDLGRATRWRSLAEIDLATGQPRILLAERKLSSYTVARDGTFVTFQEDVTTKTDYDVIGGTENALRMVPMAGGEPVTIAEAKDLRA